MKVNKKYNLYFIGVTLFLILSVLVILNFIKNHKQFSNKITLNRGDKIPYGASAAFDNLKYLFTDSKIYTNLKEPGTWDSISKFNNNQALIIISPNFYASISQLNDLLQFVNNGNDVFISANNFSKEAQTFFNFQSTNFDTSYLHKGLFENKKWVYFLLSNPPFKQADTFYYPGKRFESWFYKYENEPTENLGSLGSVYCNFIHLKTGKGNFYFHSSPLAFSNYFLLHKNNMVYFQKALSVINHNTKKIFWDEYYQNHNYSYPPPVDSYKKNWLDILLSYSSFKAALITLICTLLAYIFFEFERKQRVIPVVKPLQNDSLDFIKTIGRLYFEKGDHQNLAKKISTHFLEHVRYRYKLQTNLLDETFKHNLILKSGADAFLVSQIISLMNYIENTTSLSKKKLTNYYQLTEKFYKTT